MLLLRVVLILQIFVFVTFMEYHTAKGNLRSIFQVLIPTARTRLSFILISEGFTNQYTYNILVGACLYQLLFTSVKLLCSFWHWSFDVKKTLCLTFIFPVKGFGLPPERVPSLL